MNQEQPQGQARPGLPSAVPITRMSPEIEKIAGALAKAQGQMTMPPKSKEVEVVMKSGGKYKFHYAELSEVITSIKKPLSENELCWFSRIEHLNGSPLLLTRLLHASGQWFETEWRLRGGDDKEMAAQITYARRYSITLLTGQAAEEDTDSTPPPGGNQQQGPRGRQQGERSAPQTRQNAPGSTTPPIQGNAPAQAPNAQQAQPPKAEQGFPGAAQLDELKAVAQHNNWMGKSVTEYMGAKYGVVAVSALTLDQFRELIGTIKSKSHTAAMEALEQLGEFAANNPAHMQAPAGGAA